MTVQTHLQYTTLQSLTECTSFRLTPSGLEKTVYLHNNSNANPSLVSTGLCICFCKLSSFAHHLRCHLNSGCATLSRFFFFLRNCLKWLDVLNCDCIKTDVFYLAVLTVITGLESGDLQYDDFSSYISMFTEVINQVWNWHTGKSAHSHELWHPFVFVESWWIIQ